MTHGGRGMIWSAGRLSDRGPSRAEALTREVRENFPPDMLALRRYVVWRYEERVGKSAKIPHVGDGSGAKASSTDPATWRGFEAAARAFLIGGYDGVGFVFSPGDPYAGVGRNAPCPCGSGKKFKMCHGRPGAV